jgi:hypothetical protein
MMTTSRHALCMVLRMDHHLTEGHLAQAERHVAEGEQHIARQRKLIAELERDGHDTTTAIELLRTFEESQATHVENRDRIRAEWTNSTKT